MLRGEIGEGLAFQNAYGVLRQARAPRSAERRARRRSATRCCAPALPGWCTRPRRADVSRARWAATRRASSRPRSVRALSVEPFQRWSMFAAICPWRTRISRVVISVVLTDLAARVQPETAVLGRGGTTGLSPSVTMGPDSDMSARAPNFLRRTLLALGYHRKPSDAVARLQTLPAVAPAPGNNWPVPPDEAERLFSQAPIELISLEPTSQGVAGALKAKIAFPDDGRQLEVKWKVAPRRHAGQLEQQSAQGARDATSCSAGSWSPRTTSCPPSPCVRVPIAAYRRLDPKADAHCRRHAAASSARWRCGCSTPRCPSVSTIPARFATDPVYAYHLSNFNVLAYLVAHRDGRPGNILVADTTPTAASSPSTTASASADWIYNFLTTNWHVIRVPAIRREVVQRLRALDRGALSALATLVELQSTPTGFCVRPRPAHRSIRIAAYASLAGRVQFGLTTAEIERRGSTDLVPARASRRGFARRLLNQPSAVCSCS